jgi:hypothetical protein
LETGLLISSSGLLAIVARGHNPVAKRKIGCSTPVVLR